ncbi:MAG TPA: DNA-3-methyladenine glycosylase I [Hyphomicrobiaceae bacterium]|nr:DNA-3-methyladenine glycosylase I [Hyphomicrobiaceae bacterium]
MTPFKTIRARAETRKGGAKELAELLPNVPKPSALAKIADDRVLAEMTKRIFCSGFVWSVIDKKWPSFEKAFLGFKPGKLLMQPDEYWERLTSDAAIVRHPGKIMSVRDNAAYVAAVSKEYGSFGKFLASWPADDQVGLLDHLKKNGSRLGGMTGQYFLRFIGRDGFVTSADVIACLRDAGLDVAANPTSKRDLAKIQQVFNDWASETGLPRTHLSRICAMSVGENYDAATLRTRGPNDEM